MRGRPSLRLPPPGAQCRAGAARPPPSLRRRAGSAPTWRALGHARSRPWAPRTASLPASQVLPLGGALGRVLSSRRGRRTPAPRPSRGEVQPPGCFSQTIQNTLPARRRGNAHPLLGDPAAVVNRVRLLLIQGGGGGGASGDSAGLRHPDRQGRRESRKGREEGGAQGVEMGRPSRACRRPRPKHPSRGRLS